MILIFAYIAGLLTLINPCVLPVLPLIIASAGHKHAPYYLALGMSTTFVFLGITLTAFGQKIGLTSESMKHLGAALMILFGLLLLIPKLYTYLQLLLGRTASRATMLSNTLPQNRWGWITGGALLGAVWSPCIGPTLGAAIALAATGQSLLFAGLTMLCFSLGVSTLIILIGKGLGKTSFIKKLASLNKPIMGTTFVLVGLFLYFDGDRTLEKLAIQYLPYWIQDLSVKY